MKKLPLSAEDLYALKSVEDPQLSPDGRYLAFVRVDVDKLGNKYDRHLWLVDLTERRPTPRQFTFSAKSDFNPRWSPDSRTLAFVSTRNEKPQIYLIAVNGGEARPLTSMPNGATNPVWSHDGRRIAFLSNVNAEERAREDSGEEPPPPADALEAKHRSERQEYNEKQKTDPRVITRLPYRTGTEYLSDRRSHIYVIDVVEGAKPQRVTDGELDFNDISWTKDGSAIISTQSREPDHDPWLYRAVVSVPVPGLSKQRKPFRFLTNPGLEYFSPQVSPDGKWIAAVRVPDHGSWGQCTRLALIPVDGGPARSLTDEFDRHVADFAWAADSRSLYFLVNDRGDTHLYRVEVNSGRITRVIGGRRMLLAFSVDRAGQIAFVAHTPERPADLYLVKAGREKRLTDFNDKLLAERIIQPIEENWHTAPDGRKIQGWLLKPLGYRRGRKYPLVVNMHGGPWVMWGPSAPAIWLEWQLHAARGYAVYFCNPRGSQGYGEEHALAIQHNWGDRVMQDVLSGVDNVVAQGFVDVKRMALTGGSYAGYLTVWIIGHDSRFACAWAQRGLYNLTSFFGTSDVPQLIEREFESYGFDNVEELWHQSPLAYVRNIHTPLAIEHQDNDWRCPPSEAEQLYAALKRLKRDVVLIRYPREGHEMSRSGEPQHRVDRLNRQVEWFDKYCKAGREKEGESVR
ncbi:MAG: S9 family peptidase [Anaerolineales bacterium]|nr:S9 family peptidase [Anaerolineales bacterium]